MIIASVFTSCISPAENSYDTPSVPVHSHQWGEWEIITPATCTEKGEETRICTLDATHKETREIAINPNAHDWQQLSGTAPTCTTTGNGTRKCNLCNKEESGNNLPALGHKYGNYEVTKEPTCSDEGIETAVCSHDSSHTITRAVPIDPDAHDWKQLSGTPATCTTEGNGERECKICAKKEETLETFPALGHKFADWTQTTAPTCTEAGEETGTCTHDSSHTMTRAVPALGHQYANNWKITTPATCTTAGEETGTCTHDSSHTTTRAIPALGHQYANNWKITTPPTVVQAGTETDTCIHNTSHTRTRSITTATFTDITDFETYFSDLSDNTAPAAYTVKLNVNSLGSANVTGSVWAILKDNSDKYISLDLSGSAITGIEDSAFLSCANLTSVNIPNNVTSIGERAFDGCTGLASVNIPNGVTSIGSNAFNRCISLASINIPNSVTSIGIAAFQSCAGLTSIIIPSSVTEIKGSVFNRCTGLTSVTIPANVTKIGDWSFGNNTNLTSVTFKGTITAANFGSPGAFLGDLRDVFYATNSTNGTPGTYTTTAPVSASSVWTKQN